jgi:hypothetical protein
MNAETRALVERLRQVDGNLHGAALAAVLTRRARGARRRGRDGGRRRALPRAHERDQRTAARARRVRTKRLHKIELMTSGLQNRCGISHEFPSLPELA